MSAGEAVDLDEEPATIADGARVRAIGRRALQVLRGRVAGVVGVSETEIANSVYALFLANVKAEPTAALSLAGLLRMRPTTESVCCVITGGNVDPDAYAQMIMRQEARPLTIIWSS